MHFYSLIRPLLFALPPERAHRAAVLALKSGLLPPRKPVADARLQVKLWGLSFPNPVGLAAGFDKNAEAIDGLFSQGFGFVEAGTVTPRAQAGNAQPRMFRLVEDRAVINRLGFNNEGVELFLRHLRARKSRGIFGANIGKNKDSEDAVEDYVALTRAVAPHADYITVNISSPNTQGLRDLQQKEALNALLTAVVAARDAAAQGRNVPLLLKIAPDLSPAECEDIAETVLAAKADGLIVSNTTISRPALASEHRAETGGLSGAPLFTLSTETLARMARLTQGRIPLIGVGGIASGADAYAKIRAGASLVQLYSALVYQGFGLVERINRELLQLLARDGFSRIQEAVGIDSLK